MQQPADSSYPARPPARARCCRLAEKVRPAPTLLATEAPSRWLGVGEAAPQTSTYQGGTGAELGYPKVVCLPTRPLVQTTPSTMGATCRGRQVRVGQVLELQFRTLGEELQPLGTYPDRFPQYGPYAV